MLTNGRTTAGTAATMIDGRHTNPMLVTIHNMDNIDTLYLGDEAVTTSNGFPIDKGQDHTFTLNPLEELWAISAKGGHVVAWIRQTV